jgi:hypothetical protein
MPVSVGGVSILPAQSVSVDYSTSFEANRKLGSSIDQNDQLRFVGDAPCSISLSFVLFEGFDEAAYEFLSDNVNLTGSLGYTVDIGGNSFSNSFLDDYSVSVRPFEPVTVSAKFTSYTPSTAAITSANEETSLNTNMSGNQIVYGHTCSVLGNGGSVLNTDVLSDISYKKNYNRSPVYTLGASAASSHLVDGAEAVMTIESTGLNSLINYDGTKLTSFFTIALFDSADQSITDFPNIAMPSGSSVTAQSYNVAGGDTLAANATITHVIL